MASSTERRIILNLAISLDGYIATETGGFEWIVGDGDHSCDIGSPFDYAEFLETIDLVVMGRKSYEDCGIADFGNKTVYVATSRDIPVPDNVKLVNGDIVDVVLKERARDGGNIYLFGGGEVIDPFIKANVIDEYIVGVIPVILGTGRRLFLENNPSIPLHLDAVSSSEGVVILHYSKRD